MLGTLAVADSGDGWAGRIVHLGGGDREALAIWYGTCVSEIDVGKRSCSVGSKVISAMPSSLDRIRYRW